MKVYIIAAISLDGFIGADEDQRSTEWTTKEDLKFFIKKTKEAGTVIMGRKTFTTFNRPLKDRRLIVYTHQDNNQDLGGVEYTSKSPKDLIEQLRNENTNEVAICGGTSIYTQFLKAGVVNELYITIMPNLFGGGVKLFDDKVSFNLRLLDSMNLNDGKSILLHYEVLN